ncbi:MAG: hypothetical protein GVY10_04295 [Verrucomicrobia bacterium]|nr:hypothetical protein [Verrucomicrobiota bacterium]
MSKEDHLRRLIGFDAQSGRASGPPPHAVERINLTLSALGEPIFGKTGESSVLNIGENLLAHFRAKNRMLQGGLRPPVDLRIEKFLHRYFEGEEGAEGLRLPGSTFHLSQHGIGRALSLPPDKDSFQSEIIESFRVANGVLHNPRSDRRTTMGVFHVAEGGLPIPEDKKAVPRRTFLRLLQAALQPPRDLLRLPFTSSQEDEAHLWVSLLLRPVICPEVADLVEEKSMEVRFFAPGSMVANLDFVESIFGNAGDPFLPENDAGLDLDHWSGHTGCVILAPHLPTFTKKEVGLPPVDEATERQKRDGMCWEKEDELYNDGGAFKLTARTEEGVVVTMISDNYFGYCKKEIKTQISFAANLFGVVEEEHAGGTLAFTSYDLGEDFRLSEYIDESDYTFDEVIRNYGDRMVLKEEGYGVDKEFPDLLYLPEGARFSLPEQSILWQREGREARIKLLAGKTYLLPFGYKVRLVKPATGRRWRLIGTMPEATNCHKPCTVSGGGKSEISKSIGDAIINAPFYVQDLKEDLDAAEKILKGNYGHRFKDTSRNRDQSRPLLGPKRSLGSVIKLLTPSDEYTREYNDFLRRIPTHVKELVLLVKRFYKPEWGDAWKERFSVDIINGIPGHELKHNDRSIVTSYLRLGYDQDGSWRVFSLRKDFFPADKLQTEDDITASVVVPWKWIAGKPGKAQGGASAKVVRNCEYRLFQRPDDAVIRGYDAKTEEDMSACNNFFSNYHALTREEAHELLEDAVHFDEYTEPVKRVLREFVAHPDRNPAYLVVPSHPRIVDGKPTKNPRYLQNRPTLEDPQSNYIAEMGARLRRRIKADEKVLYPVNGLLPGRRNNPPDGPVRSLAVFNPIHYLPLPEAFMEFTSSMTGKSPSTTGAGSEGALTKAPFNALLPITDLNNALVAAALTGLKPYITAAGYIGPNFRVDHDISLLVPELWCRMKKFERNPDWLREKGFLEPVPELEFEGKPLPTGILGYRINQLFVNYFLGRIFTSPEMLFDEDMLQPEKQDLAIFADGLDNMMTTHRKVAGNYFRDGSIELACPPLKALLHIMRDGAWEGKGLSDPEVRALFDPEAILQSDWYRERIASKQARDIGHWQRMLTYLKDNGHAHSEIEALRMAAEERLQKCQGDDYHAMLQGTIGREIKLHPCLD